LALTLLILALLLIIAALAFRRAGEIRERDLAWAALAARTPWQAPPFAPAMLDGLPEPARCFLAAAIRPGTLLRVIHKPPTDDDLVEPAGRCRRRRPSTWSRRAGVHPN